MKNITKEMNNEKVNQELIVVKSNPFIESCYHLSRNEQIVILMGIAKLDSMRHRDSNHHLVFNVREFCSVYNILPKKAYDILSSVSHSIRDKEVFLIPSSKNGKGEKLYRSCFLVSLCEYRNGEMTIMFHPSILNFLLQIDGRFTQYYLSEIACFKNPRTIRFYEFLSQWQGRASITEIRGIKVKEFIFKISIEQLRLRLFIEPNKYKNHVDFDKRCVQEPLREIDSFLSFYEYQAGEKFVKYANFTDRNYKLKKDKEIEIDSYQEHNSRLLHTQLVQRSRNQKFFIVDYGYEKVRSKRFTHLYIRYFFIP